MTENTPSAEAESTSNGPETAATDGPETSVSDGPEASASSDIETAATSDGSEAAGAVSASTQPGPAKPPAGGAGLEEEGEIAADYLEELLDIADIGGDIEIDVENDRAAVAILADDADGSNLERLVGPEGEVLDALQELTRLAVQTKTGERSRLMLDVAGHRAARRSELERLAGEVVAEVRQSGQATALEPMNPFERKVVHDVVAAAGLASDSEGEEPTRYVVVRPA